MKVPLIGMLVQDEYFDAIKPGHMHHPFTYNFEIEWKCIKNWAGSFCGGWNLNAWVSAAKELEKMGIKAVTCNCGKTGVMQKELNRAVEIPVFTSSLLQIPTVKRFLSPNKKVGVITAPSAKEIWKQLQESCEIDPNSIEVFHAGGGSWGSQFAKNQTYDYVKVRDQLTEGIVNFVKSKGNIGALVLECTELPLYSGFIQTVTKLPVFDAVTMVNWVYTSLSNKRGLHECWELWMAPSPKFG